MPPLPIICGGKQAQLGNGKRFVTRGRENNRLPLHLWKTHSSRKDYADKHPGFIFLCWPQLVCQTHADHTGAPKRVGTKTPTQTSVVAVVVVVAEVILIVLSLSQAKGLPTLNECSLLVR